MAYGCSSVEIVFKNKTWTTIKQTSSFCGFSTLQGHLGVCVRSGKTSVRHVGLLSDMIRPPKSYLVFFNTNTLK